MSYYVRVSNCHTLSLSWVSNCLVSNCPVTNCLVTVSNCLVSNCPGFVEYDLSCTVASFLLGSWRTDSGGLCKINDVHVCKMKTCKKTSLLG